MSRIRILSFAVAASAAAMLCLSTGASLAAPFNQGPKTCQECHKSEVDVWKDTKHAKSFKTVHKTDKAKGILKAIGAKSMKKEASCGLCHYTAVQKDADSKPRPKAGPSCESCHGASSDWLDIHNDYGGKSGKRDDESPEHKAQRMEQAAAAGMIWPSNLYDVASNCMTCHGLANPDLDGDTLSAMLAGEHPLNPDFELVRYSQGVVRHRFYPPDVNTNQEMTPAELARMFVIGQAAKLVSAVGAQGRSDSAKYKEFQEARAAAAHDRHRVELVVDRLTVRSRDSGRLNEAVERALELSSGEIIIASPNDNEEDRLSRHYSCPSCGDAFSPLHPQSVSFNHQQGMCSVCEGIGDGDHLIGVAGLPDRLFRA